MATSRHTGVPSVTTVLHSVYVSEQEQDEAWDGLENNPPASSNHQKTNQT